MYLPLLYNSQFKQAEGERPFENFVVKGEIAGYQHFLLLSQYFISFQSQFVLLCNYVLYLYQSSTMLSCGGLNLEFYEWV